MSEPIILSTWSFGRRANAAGWPILASPNGSSLDAVEQACRAVESDLEVNSVGRGGCPDRSGEVSLDASIMQSPARCGSVCYVRRFEHPVSIARMVMERLQLVLLAGDGADRFAMRQGLTPSNLLTDGARAMWQKWAADHPDFQYWTTRLAFRRQPEHRGDRSRRTPRRPESRCRTTSTMTPWACWRSTPTAAVRRLLDQRPAVQGAGPGRRFADHRPRAVRRSAARRAPWPPARANW